MSDISRFLAAIRTATFGEEVRGAIHDAIEQCYDDVSSAKTLADDTIANMEQTISDAEAQIDESKDSALYSITSTKNQAVSDINTAKNQAVTAANNATESVTNTANSATSTVNQTKESAVSAINTAVGTINQTTTSAVNTINQKVTDATQDIDDATEAATSAAEHAETAAGVVDDHLDDIVVSQTTQPSSAYNKVWLKPGGTDIVLAEMSDVEKLESAIELSNNGYEFINTVYSHGKIDTTTGAVTVSENNYKYQAVTPNLIKFDRDITIKAASGYVFQAYWYDSNGTFISRTGKFVSEYLMVSSNYFRLFVRLDPHDTSADVDINVFKQNVYLFNAVGERVEDIENKPLSTLPTYILNNMAEKPLGILSKGYILLSFDDGAATLATGTIPLLIENNVPGTFGLLPQSEIFAEGNESELATVVDAVENHGCVVAMHGSDLWPTYAEAALYDYINSTIALFDSKGLGVTYGAICPGGNGDDTSALVKAVAGGKFGYVFSGNRVDKISYDTANADGKFNGARSNRFDLDRRSGIGITTAKVQAIVNYAAENHLLLCPFWHDNTLNDGNHTEYITYFNALISAAKDAGLTFITTKDLPNIT